MNTRLFLATTLTTAALTALTWAQDETAAAPDKDGSYAVGTRIGIQFSKGDLSMNDFMAGFTDQVNGNDLRLSKEAMDQALEAFQITYNANRKAAKAKAQAAAAEAGKVNLVAAEAFLKENGALDGVFTTASGLQYSVTEPGTGASPKASDKVKVHYHGTLLDGTVFDSSKEKGKPFETQLTRVVKGWTEGIPLMKVGGKSRLFIPPSLAYGERDRSGIPANSLLIFDVELLEIVSVQPKAPVQAVTPPVAIPPRAKKPAQAVTPPVAIPPLKKKEEK